MDAARFDDHFGTRAAGSEGPLATQSGLVTFIGGRRVVLVT